MEIPIMQLQILKRNFYFVCLEKNYNNKRE